MRPISEVPPPKIIEKAEVDETLTTGFMAELDGRIAARFTRFRRQKPRHLRTWRGNGNRCFRSVLHAICRSREFRGYGADPETCASSRIWKKPFDAMFRRAVGARLFFAEVDLVVQSGSSQRRERRGPEPEHGARKEIEPKWNALRSFQPFRDNERMLLIFSPSRFLGETRVRQSECVDAEHAQARLSSERIQDITEAIGASYQSQDQATSPIVAEQCLFPITYRLFTVKFADDIEIIERSGLE